MSSLKSYISPKAEFRKSKIEGKGLFAKKTIKKGEIVAIRLGHVVNFQEAQKYDKEIGDYSMQITDEFFLCPKKQEEVKDFVLYINHSCNPNVLPYGQITFIAFKDIKPSQELLCDYATIIGHEYHKVCNCGNKNCRKIITGNDWKLKSLQDKYDYHFSWFLLKKIKKLE